MPILALESKMLTIYYTFRKETKIVGLSMKHVSETVRRVLANEKPVFSGCQGSPKAHRL